MFLGPGFRVAAECTPRSWLSRAMKKILIVVDKPMGNLRDTEEIMC
jgi:hypothetical protein